MLDGDILAAELYRQSVVDSPACVEHYHRLTPYWLFAVSGVGLLSKVGALCGCLFWQLSIICALCVGGYQFAYFDCAVDFVSCADAKLLGRSLS